MSSFSQSRIAWCQNELSQRSNSSTALTGQYTLTSQYVGIQSKPRGAKRFRGEAEVTRSARHPLWQHDHCDRWFKTTWYRIASMKNVLGDGRWTQRGEVVCECRLAVQQLEGVGVQSRGGARPVPPWRTLWPTPFPTPGKAWCTYVVCGCCRHNSQSKPAYANFAQFVFPLYSFMEISSYSIFKNRRLS